MEKVEEMEEKLIKAVEVHPMFYDKNDLDYRNKRVKEKVWKRIALRIGVDVKQCQCRWRSLRDRYVRESLKIEPGSGTPDPAPWKYHYHLSFLRPHVRERRSVSTMSFDYDPLSSPTQPAKREILPYWDTDSQLESQSAISFEHKKRAPSMVLETDSLSAKSFRQPEIPPSKCLPQADTQLTKSCEELLEPSFESKRDNERCNLLIGAVTDLLSLHMNNEVKSRNADFLKVLDGYLLQLPENVQDEVKVEMLNFVYHKKKEISAD